MDAGRVIILGVTLRAHGNAVGVSMSGAVDTTADIITTLDQGT
jgi:hypothetical protein